MAHALLEFLLSTISKLRQQTVLCGSIVNVRLKNKSPARHAFIDVTVRRSVNEPMEKRRQIFWKARENKVPEYRKASDPLSAALVLKRKYYAMNGVLNVLTNCIKCFGLSSLTISHGKGIPCARLAALTTYLLPDFFINAIT